MRGMLVVVAGALAEICAAAPASGHAPPEGTGLWWIPGQPAGGVDERLVIRTNRGLIVQSGSTFNLLCNEAIGVSPSEDAPMAVAAGGGMFVATFAGGLIAGAPGLCDWQPPAGAAAGLPAFDVTTAPGTPAALYLVAGKSDTATNFFVSRDLSSSWSALATSSIPYTRVRISPSNPARIYRTGVGLGADSQPVHRLAVSDDGGVTGTEHLLALGTNELQARVLEVDPTDPDRVYVKVEATSEEYPERLIVSEDGGRIFSTALTLQGFRGFALSPDGVTVWAGGTAGLWRSTNRGAHFAQIASAGLTRVGCLAFHGDRLYGCGVTSDQFNVSVSLDRGLSFRKLLDFSQVAEIVSCADGSPVTTSCQGPMEHWRAEVATFSASAGATTNGGTGGVTASPASSEVGAVASTPAASTAAASGCSVGPGGDTEVLGLIFLLGATALWLLRRSDSDAEAEVRSLRAPELPIRRVASIVGCRFSVVDAMLLPCRSVFWDGEGVYDVAENETERGLCRVDGPRLCHSLGRARRPARDLRRRLQD